MAICTNRQRLSAKAIEETEEEGDVWDGLGALRLLWPQIQQGRHPAELGQRTCVHLPHQVGAMHLHRRFGDANVVSNLFV